MHRSVIAHRPASARVLIRTLSIAALSCTAACTLTSEVPGTDPPATVPESSAVSAGPAPPPSAGNAAVPAETPPAPQPSPSGRVLVLRSSDVASYRAVADALDGVLGGRYELRHASLDDPDAGSSMTGDGAPGWEGAIAIGAAAAELAGRELRVPTVFCQILDYGALLSQRDSLYGVEALPPLALQLSAWRKLAADAGSAGVILAAGETRLADAARQAATDVGVELHVEYAASDREVLYRFKRLAPAVDGLWLLPDNRILSPRVLREIFDYARRHGVHSIVFNPALLAWGALLSVGSDTQDVAATVARVLEALTGGRSEELERVTPLSSVDLRINEKTAAELGLGPPGDRITPELAAR